jgi:FAD/FMN-containing dehydrogenase
VGERAPALQAALGAARAAIEQALPNVGADVQPFSGSYTNEADSRDAAWAVSNWGAANYARLRAVKDAVDPDGLFYCFHCVGSEDWQPGGNCRHA